MASKERTAFENPVVEWFDSRLPIFTMMQKEYGVFPTPRNFNYFWNFGAIAMVMLVTMIVTGISLAMHYNPSTAGAFDSVERIMRDVNHGWLIRYLHMNGASFFFIAVYIHIFRGLYYGSYKKPRELLWLLGMVIFLLMMATGFMGYVLPWGQMSFWGATVITNLFSAIPLVGDSIVTLLWGGFSVDNPTLNRFFALHYLLPFVIVGVVFLHIWALHVTGSNNPLGINVKDDQDTLPFHPYYTMKDMFGVTVFLAIYVLFTFFMPNALGHPDNYIPANPLVTPAHIVPEWYFLPFYAILRAITFDLNLYLAGAGAIAVVLIYNYCWCKRPYPVVAKNIVFLVLGAAVLGVPGAMLAFLHDVPALKGVIDHIPFKAFSVMPAKLGGVLSMGGAIAVLFLMPFLDNHPVRSSRFRPWYRPAILILLVVFVILGICGSKPAEGLWVPLAQVMTLCYFGFFLVAVPFFSNNEPVRTLPNSIHEAVLAMPRSLILAVLGAALLALAPHAALAKNFSNDAVMDAKPQTDQEETGPKPSTKDDVGAHPEKAAPPKNGPAEITGPGMHSASPDVGAAPADQKMTPPETEKSAGQPPTPGAEVPAQTSGAAAPVGQAAPLTTATGSESSHDAATAGETKVAPAEQPSAHEEIKLMDEHWGFQSPLGSYDRASLQRGYQVYKQVCSACHSMKRVYFRNLTALGYSDAQIKAVAGEYTVTDGPNDEGEMFERPAKPSDHFKSPYPNDNASKAANNGALPPDLSLIVKAREGGANYVFSILNGYEKPPAGVELAPNQHWNKYMAGHKIAMPAPLSDGAVSYEDGTPGTVYQYAHDVAEFLAWAAEPEMEERKQTGIKALIFLVLLGGVMYRVKKKIWSKVH